MLLAASAASPVGGDELELVVDVGPGARADVGSVAANMAWPSPVDLWSSTTTRCSVATDAHVRLWLEPTVSVAGSRHRATTTAVLADGASCLIVEEVALGRHGEPSGRFDQRLRVERSSGVLIDHGEVFGPDVPGALSSVSVGAARHAFSAVLVGVSAGESRVCVEPTSAAAWLPVDGDAVVVLALGPDRPSVRAAVCAIASELATPTSLW